MNFDPNTRANLEASFKSAMSQLVVQQLFQQNAAYCVGR